MRAILFANGELAQLEQVRSHIQPKDMLIAADGGARHCLRLGLNPHAVVGDFDSLSPSELATLESQGAHIVRFPARKDYTDLELAVQYARDLGCRQLLVFGALGQRWDQTLANLLLPAAPGLESMHIRLVAGAQEISLVQAGQTLQIEGLPGDTVSLIPISQEAAGITTTGLEYPLHRETLYLGATRGVSNTLIAAQASVTLQQGLLLCTIIHHEEEKQDEQDIKS